jgi:hypothetical protein
VSSAEHRNEEQTYFATVLYYSRLDLVEHLSYSFGRNAVKRIFSKLIIVLFYYYCKGTNVRGDKMVKMSLGTNDRNNPGNVKGHGRVTLF